MRIAARVNAQALRAAGGALTDGATREEIETVYMTEMAPQGARGVYCICGVAGLPAGIVRRGEPILLDALSQSRHHRGRLGLEHADDPRSVGTPPGTKPDQVLEPGRVINVDMPYTETGWGSLHLEDRVLVTADGHELLSTAALDLRCVPG